MKHCVVIDILKAILIPQPSRWRQVAFGPQNKQIRMSDTSNDTDILLGFSKKRFLMIQSELVDKEGVFLFDF